MHGVSLHQQGLLDAARTVYEQVLAKHARHFDALHLSGVIAYQQGDAQRSALFLSQALALDPDNSGAHSNLGLALLHLQRFEEALASFERAVALRPQFADAHLNRGDALLALCRFEEAVGSYGRALALNSALTKVHAKRGFALLSLTRYQEALDDYDIACRVDPPVAETLSNRGAVLKALGRLEEALAICRQAIAIDPKLASAFNTLGTVLMALQRMPEAEAVLDHALALDPGQAEAHWNKAMLLLLQGRLREGWPLHEWRWFAGISATPLEQFDVPRWLGAENLTGKTLLLHCEQGFGDTLQFCRYARMAKEAGARVLLEVPSPLASLLASLDGVDQLIEYGQARPSFDLHCPLLSLPMAFGTDLESIPSPGPYLSCPPERRRLWAQRLGEGKAPRVGLAWAGNPAHTRDGERSLPLMDLLAALPEGLEYVSLQKMLRPGDREALAARGVRHFGDELQDFADTAGLCDLMDQVVTVDTSIAHLAGAMGKPTWVMLTWNPDWRWLLDRRDSPWYGSVTLYRQPQRGDWSAVLGKVAEDLRAHYALQVPA